MSDLIQTVADNMVADLKAFRSATVAADGKATPFARSILASLVTGARTKETIVATVLHAFGNPKSEAGKPIATMSGGAHIKGFPAVRETVKSVFRIYENVDVAGVKPLIVAFVLDQADAPQRINGLATAVKNAIAAAAAADVGDNSDAVEENKADEAPKVQVDAPTAVSLVDRINALNVAIGADPEALADEATDAAIAALMDTIRSAYALIVGDDVVQELEEAA